MSVPAGNLSRILVTGTSLTQTGVPSGNWQGRPGSLTDQLRAALINYNAAPIQSYAPARLGQAAAAYAPFPQQGRRQVVMGWGVGGRTVSGLQGDLPASIYAWKPDIIVIEICCNDFGGGTNVTPGGAFQVSYNAVLDGIAANLPNAKVLCLNETVRGETVTGANFSDGTNTWAGNTRIMECVASHQSFCTFVDVNTPALTYCIANNSVGGVTPRYLTIDSLHQSNTGADIIATAVMAQLAMS